MSALRPSVRLALFSNDFIEGPSFRELALDASLPVRTFIAVLLLSVASRIDRLIRRDKAKLTPDRVAYFCHPDWVVSPGRVSPAGFWRPEIATDTGLKQTAEWYRAKGWL